MDNKVNKDRVLYDYSGVPPDAKAEGLFCLYRIEAKSRDAPKLDKIPYTRYGNRADSGNRSDFGSFADIHEVYEQGGYEGIGMGNFLYCMVDVDDCIHDGELDERGRDIIETVNSYTEISPSGTGAHIFCKADHLDYDRGRYYINNRKVHVEVYVPGTTNRFLTMTGKCIHGNAIEERSEELKAVLEKYMVRPQADKPIPKVEAPGSYFSDEEALRKMFASKQGEKARELWEGNIPDGKTHSEADMAFAEICAFWCGGDIEQMDRLFRQSGLMRDKWDRPQSGSTYGYITLEKAVCNCTAFYQPIRTAPAEDFNDVLHKLEELNPLDNIRYRSGDIGFGRLLADVFKDIARFVPERKKWFVYDGKRWAADTAGLMIMELSKDLADALLIYTSSIKDEDKRKAFLEGSKRWQQRRYREIYIKEAQSVYPLSMEVFDTNPYLFNCDNATVDFSNGKAKAHSHLDYITKISPVIYDPEAYSERFIRFVDEVTCRDKARARFLQKSLSYGFTGLTFLECLFILYGATTRNGKGTLMEALLQNAGDYGKAVRPETITQKRNPDSQAPSEDIARLMGVRFANISEPARGLVLNSAQVKSMTGNDTQNARFLHENSFDFKPQYKLYINTNYLPVITDMTIFDSNRLYIIPFDRHFEEWEQDRTLKTEFGKPEVQSAILNWLIEGFQLLQEEGLGKPDAIANAVSDYRHDSDKVSQFAEERLVANAQGEIRTSVVYNEYRRWCEENGCYPENSRNFNLELRKFGDVQRKRPRTGGEKTTLLLGYIMKDDFLADSDS